jgi:hypothetical protein
MLTSRGSLSPSMRTGTVAHAIADDAHAPTSVL